MWPALLESWGRACRRPAPSSRAEGQVGKDGRGGIKGGAEPRRSSGEGAAQRGGLLQQVESRDFEGVWAGCTLGPCPLQTGPRTRSSAHLGLSVLPCTVGTWELPGSILRGRACGVQLCGYEALPPRLPCLICEPVGFPGSKRPSQKLVKQEKRVREGRFQSPSLPLLDLLLPSRAGGPRAGAAKDAGNWQLSHLCWGVGDGLGAGGRPQGP